MAWSPDDVPDLSGQVIAITGGNSGIGFEAARILGAAGARVIIACRSEARAAAALERLAAAAPGASLESVSLDLASLASVRACAEALGSMAPRLDVLVNNAGLMALPRRETADGFEMQLGTNHLGHFALRGLLLERLAEGGRVVNVSSHAHRMGRIAFDDLHGRRSYQRWLAYGQSKLANMLFTLELDRRAKAGGAALTAAACHPGYASTNLQTAGAKMEGSSLKESFFDAANRLFAQSAAKGSWPTVYAASAPLAGGEYVGPGGLGAMAGAPRLETPARRARDEEAAARLWALSEEATGVRWPAIA